MKLNELYGWMSRLSLDGVVEEAFGIHLAISFERVLRFSEIGKPPIAIDLGSGGGTLISMAIPCKFLGGKVYAVDILDLPTEGTERVIKEFGLTDTIEFLKLDDISDEAKEFFKDIRPNVIFIDTTHTYEHTIKELEFYSKILSVNGFMIFHDTYDRYGYGYGVDRALEEFLKDNDSFMIEDMRKNHNGIGVIKKIKEGANE